MWLKSARANSFEASVALCKYETFWLSKFYQTAFCSKKKGSLISSIVNALKTRTYCAVKRNNGKPYLIVTFYQSDRIVHTVQRAQICYYSISEQYYYPDLTIIEFLIYLINFIVIQSTIHLRQRLCIFTGGNISHDRKLMPRPSLRCHYEPSLKTIPSCLAYRGRHQLSQTWYVSSAASRISQAEQIVKQIIVN